MQMGHTLVSFITLKGFDISFVADELRYRVLCNKKKNKKKTTKHQNNNNIKSNNIKIKIHNNKKKDATTSIQGQG